MIVQGLQDGEVYGADSPLYISVSSGLNETIVSVTLLITSWYGDKVTDEPLDPDYTLERDTDSFGTQATFTEFNVAPFAKDVLRFDNFTGAYPLNSACWMKVEYLVSYIDTDSNPQSILGDLIFACTNGYGRYEQEANFLLNPFHYGAEKINATIGSTYDLTVLANQITGGATKTINSVTATYSDGTIDTRNLPAVTDNTNDLYQKISFNVTDVDYIDIESDVSTYGSFRVYPKKPYTYDPIKVGYLDANGTISYLTFFGNNKEISEYKRDSHRVYTGSTYGRNVGNRRTFRTNGMESISVNSDWVDETFYDSIDEMLLSKYVFFEVESLNCGLEYDGRVEADGGTFEGGQCLSNKLEMFGVNPSDYRTDPTYEVSDRIAVIPDTNNIDRMKNVDELINYKVTFKKAFDKKPTYL